MRLNLNEAPDFSNWRDTEEDRQWLCISLTPVSAPFRQRNLVWRQDKNFGAQGKSNFAPKTPTCEFSHLWMQITVPQVSSSSPEPRPGPSEDAHTLAFVWGASKLPHRLIKGAKEMKESIKVTLSLHPAHTHTHTHKCWFHYKHYEWFICHWVLWDEMHASAASQTFLPLLSKHLLLKQNHTLSLCTSKPFLFSSTCLSGCLSMLAGFSPPLRGYAHICAKALWNDMTLCPHRKVCLPVSGSTLSSPTRKNEWHYIVFIQIWLHKRGYHEILGNHMQSC